MQRIFKPRVLVAGAALCIVLAIAVAPLGSADYVSRLHGLAVRGALGMPWAQAFNVLAFMVPGALLALAGWRLRAGLTQAGVLARIGLAMVQLSALAHAAQGLLPLDLEQIEAGDAGRDAHAMAWALWWVAFVPGALLLGMRARRGAGFSRASVTAALAVLVIGVLLPVASWQGLQQRVALLAWLAWWWLAARRLSRA